MKRTLLLLMSCFLQWHGQRLTKKSKLCRLLAARLPPHVVRRVCGATSDPYFGFPDDTNFPRPQVQARRCDIQRVFHVEGKEQLAARDGEEGRLEEVDGGPDHERDEEVQMQTVPGTAEPPVTSKALVRIHFPAQ